MSQFVDQGERPSRTVILIVDDNEWRDRIGQREAAERFHVYRCMVASEMPYQQNKHACGFGSRAKQREGKFRRPLSAELCEIDSKCPLDRIKNCLDAVGHGHRTDE